MKPGRPRIDPSDTSVQVCLTMSARSFDQACADARRADVSVPEVLRRQLAAATVSQRRRDDDDG